MSSTFLLLLLFKSQQIILCSLANCKANGSVPNPATKAITKNSGPTAFSQCWALFTAFSTSSTVIDRGNTVVTHTMRTGWKVPGCTPFNTRSTLKASSDSSFDSVWFDVCTSSMNSIVSVESAFGFKQIDSNFLAVVTMMSFRTRIAIAFTCGHVHICVVTEEEVLWWSFKMESMSFLQLHRSKTACWLDNMFLGHVCPAYQ